MELLNTIILSITFGFITILATGAIWVVTSSDKERRSLVKERVWRFSKIVIIMIIPATVYFFPEDLLTAILDFFHKEPWILKAIIILPVYACGILLLIRLIKEIWGE